MLLLSKGMMESILAGLIVCIITCVINIVLILFKKGFKFTKYVCILVYKDQKPKLLEKYKDLIKNDNALIRLMEFIMNNIK
jgi:hypothetical protein